MNARLIIVEADPFDREIITKVFKGKYLLQFVADIDEAKKFGKIALPDVMIVDIKTPSPELLEKIRLAKQREHGDIPLILVVSENHLDSERFAREIGVFYYLIKPYDFKELSEALERAVTHAAKNKVIP